MRINSGQNCMRTGSDVCLVHYCRTVDMVFCRHPHFILVLWRFGAFLFFLPMATPISFLQPSLFLPGISLIWSNLRYPTWSRLFNLQAPCVLYEGQTYRSSPQYSFCIFSQQIYLCLYNQLLHFFTMFLSF